MLYLDVLWEAYMSGTSFPRLRRMGIVHEPFTPVARNIASVYMVDLKTMRLCLPTTYQGQLASLENLARIKFVDEYHFAVYALLTVLQTFLKEDRKGLQELSEEDYIYVQQLRDLLAAYFACEWHHAMRDVALPGFIAPRALSVQGLLENRCDLLKQFVLMSCHLWLTTYAVAHFVQPDGRLHIKQKHPGVIFPLDVNPAIAPEITELYTPVRHGTTVESIEIVPVSPKLKVVKRDS